MDRTPLDYARPDTPRRPRVDLGYVSLAIAVGYVPALAAVRLIGPDALNLFAVAALPTIGVSLARQRLRASRADGDDGGCAVIALVANAACGAVAVVVYGWRVVSHL